MLKSTLAHSASVSVPSPRATIYVHPEDAVSKGTRCLDPSDNIHIELEGVQVVRIFVTKDAESARGARTTGPGEKKVNRQLDTHDQDWSRHC